MFGYQTPDVYIREESGGARPIQAVGTSTPGFIGVAPYAKAHKPDGSLQAEVVPINNWSQFVKEFCVAPENSAEPIDPANYFASTKLAHAVYGFFLNGGSRCYVVNVGNLTTTSTRGKSKASATAGGDESDSSSASTPGNTSRQGVDDPNSLPPIEDGLSALETYDDVAIVVAPSYTDKDSQDKLVAHCENLADRVPILDVPGADLKPTDIDPNNTNKSYEMPQSNKGFGAVYYPWIAVRDPLDRNSREPIMVPPSGHIAGVWARTDATRGVHKAPANEPLRGAISLAYRLTRDEQGGLNTAGINCIRHFSREGIRVWGARTINTDEWRYLNVRRLFNMIEESIAESTRWTVFEPNDQTLWKSIRRDINAFLTNIWRTGALMGATPEEAFFVKCDEETNPPEVVDSGTVITIIGIAPVKPAEFVVFRIRQASGSNETEGA